MGHFLKWIKNYIKAGIDILNNIIDIWLVLSDELKHFLEFLVKRPVPQTLNFCSFDFVNGDALSAVNRMIVVKTVFANETCCFLAITIDANIQNLFSLMTFDQTFGGHSPFGTKYLFKNFLSFGCYGLMDDIFRLLRNLANFWQGKSRARSVFH